MSFTKYGNIILSWKTNTALAFAEMLRIFIPPPATIVDLCAGERRMYRRLNNGNTLDGKNYKFIFGDIRKIHGNQYVCDIRNPPKELYDAADGFIFDPPWPSTSGSLRKMVQKYHPLPQKEFPSFLEESLKNIDKILKKHSVLIVKISHPWNHIIYNTLTQQPYHYKWRRDIVQVCVNHNVYLVCHYMVFEKS